MAVAGPPAGPAAVEDTRDLATGDVVLRLVRPGSPSSRYSPFVTDVGDRLHSVALRVEQRLHPELPVGVVRPRAGRWAMAEALEVVDRRFGGVDNYLCQTAGVCADALEALCERVLN